MRGKDNVQKDKVRNVLTQTVAYQLAAVGFGPADITNMQNDGLDPLSAGTRMISASPSVEDMLTVSPVAAIGTITSNQPTSGDEVLRTAVVSIDRNIRGSAGQRLELQLQMPAPLSGAKQGQQFLLFLSDDLAKFRSAAGRRSEGNTAMVGLPYEVTGAAIVPISPGQGPDQSTIAQVDQFVARHPKTFSAK